jgi:hypothetical protein
MPEELVPNRGNDAVGHFAFKWQTTPACPQDLISWVQFITASRRLSKMPINNRGFSTVFNCSFQEMETPLMVDLLAVLRSTRDVRHLESRLREDR